MGTALECCASNDDGIENNVGDERREKLFGNLNNSDDSDEQENSFEERLRDLIPKIRSIKQ